MKTFEIETLTDIQLLVGSTVQTSEGKDGNLLEEKYIYFLTHGYYSKEDKEVEIPSFISVSEAKKLIDVLTDLIN